MRTSRNHIGKQRIQNALLNLMRDKPFSKISITNICEIAGISRTTYYYYYYETYEVLNDILDRIIDDLKNFTCLQTLTDETIRNSYSELIKYFYDHRETLKIVFSNDCSHLLQNRYEKMCAESNEHWCKATDPNGKLKSYNTLAFKYIASGQFSVLKYWILSDCEVPQASLVNIFLSFSNSSVISTKHDEPLPR